MNDKSIAGSAMDTAINQQAAGFSKVTIEGMVRVVLVEARDQEEISIKGRASLLHMIEVLKMDKEVVIRTKKNRSFLHAVTVYVPVRNLHTVNIKSDANISSSGTLYSSLLNVYINGNCSVSIKVLGRINVIEGDHFFFVPTGNYERSIADYSIAPTLIQSN